MPGRTQLFRSEKNIPLTSDDFDEHAFAILEDITVGGSTPTRVLTDRPFRKEARDDDYGNGVMSGSTQPLRAAVESSTAQE